MATANKEEIFDYEKSKVEIAVLGANVIIDDLQKEIEKLETENPRKARKLIKKQTLLTDQVEVMQMFVDGDITKKEMEKKVRKLNIDLYKKSVGIGVGVGAAVFAGVYLVLSYFSDTSAADITVE